MTKTEILTRYCVDAASRLALARVLDKAELARTRDIPAHSQFLTDGEQKLADQALAAFGNPRRRFWGGYEGAERRVCVFLADWEEDMTDDPLTALEVTPPPDAQLSHRDYLGAMMGLGLNREGLGDILVADGRGQVVCLKTVAPALLRDWREVGRYAVSVREIPLAALEPGEKDVKVRRETFQSLRFDAVAAAGFGLSRAKAAALIASGRVQLNHLPCTKPDRILEPGDSMTSKGLGKCVLARVTGESKKGRVMAELERYT